MSGGVAKCYAFSRLQENISLGNLPAIRHVKCADAVVVDDYPLGGDAVLLFSVVHVDVVDQLGHHALGDFRCVSVQGLSIHPKFTGHKGNEDGRGACGHTALDLNAVIQTPITPLKRGNVLSDEKNNEKIALMVNNFSFSPGKLVNVIELHSSASIPLI